jgi:hypothetical protein
MTSHVTRLKAYEGSWYRLGSDDDSECAELTYDTAGDSLVLALPGNTVAIPGK